MTLVSDRVAEKARGTLIFDTSSQRQPEILRHRPRHHENGIANGDSVDVLPDRQNSSSAITADAGIHRLWVTEGLAEHVDLDLHAMPVGRVERCCMNLDEHLITDW